MALTLSVIPRKPEIIFPAKPTPHEIKQVSVIDDQESFRCHYPMIMFYKSNPAMQGKDPVKIIREALSKTLVYYYPYAGRLIEGPDNRLMVHCTAEGVVFMEADANATIEQLGDTVLPPCPYPDLLLCDFQGSNGMHPLMLVQVTRFMCGGFVLAIRFNHVLSDALGSLQFVIALNEMTKGASTPSIIPLWRRDLLVPRNPPNVTHSHPEYVEEGNGIIPPAMNADKLVRKLFSFGPKEVKAIRKNLPPEFRNAPKFDLITACLWRSRTKALQYDPDDDVRLSCMVNARGKSCLNLPSGYYGNAVICPAVVSKAKLLCDSPLEYGIKLVREARKQATEDYSRSTLDFLATSGRLKLTNRWNFIASDASKVGFDEIDFGWGKAVYGGTMYGGTFHNNTVYARYRNRKGEDVMVAPICLPATGLNRFEDELKRLLCEPTEDYSNTSNSIIVSSKL